MAQQYNVISSSLSTSYTGSIAKLQAFGNGSAPDGATYTASLDRIEWGDPKENPMNPKSHANYTHRGLTTGPIEIPVGGFIEGPISAVKTANGDGKSGWLIYTV